jgi:single-stranded-DNA-specific exonuclease
VPSQWIIAPAEELGGHTVNWGEICGSDCIARLLSRMGFNSSSEVDLFLRPRLKSLTDPLLLPQMEQAVLRLIDALDRGQRLVLFGDYDVDGITSLALLSTILNAYGAKPGLFLPLRKEEGYGLSRDSVERCLEQFQPQLLVAVDCGTSSVQEIATLKARGVDVIVLDHHEPKSELPECVAIVNPKIDHACAFHYLCSVGIVFKLCHALLKARPLAGFDLRVHLDLVALGTVADIVPLRGENRTLVQRGAQEIARSSRPGLRKLMQISGVRPPILPEDIGFRLGPRLNAAGRLSTAEKALQLLLTNDETECENLARLLDQQNSQRQEVERNIVAAAEAKIASEYDPSKHAAIIVGAPDWHPGVLGIVASRIARRFHRPTIVIGFDENGSGKGSGRSIEGLSIVEALHRCQQWLDKYGGHEMAAGVSLRQENMPGFVEAFQQAARELLTDEQLQPRLRVDHELAFCDLNFDFLQWHELLQPFGNGNPQPVFCARAVEPVAAPQVVKEKHLVLRLRQKNFRQRAIYFDGARFELPPPPWDIAFQISADEYEGQTRLGMQVQALRQSTSAN